MAIVLIDVLRALRALRRDPGCVSLAILLLLMIVSGGVFYWLVEDLRPLDAAYLSVITLTTVGYGEPAPATDAGKVFTAVFVLVGMGILLAFLTSLSAQIRRQSVLRGPLDRRAARHDASRPRTDPWAPDAGDAHRAADLASVGEFDLVVIGSDDANRRAALEAAHSGLRVAIVDARHMGAGIVHGAAERFRRPA